MMSRNHCLLAIGYMIELYTAEKINNQYFNWSALLGIDENIRPNRDLASVTYFWVTINHAMLTNINSMLKTKLICY